MAGSKIPYLLALVALLLLNGLIFLTPFAAFANKGTGDLLYTAFAPTCHQLTSRSLCLFKSNDGKLSIADCMESDSFSSTHATTITRGAETGYKFPVCARDMGIYLAMFLGLLILPFVQKIEGEGWPNKWIIATAAVPIALDGGTQLIGLRESSNLLREITGAIVGVVLPFYIVPMLNSLYSFLQQKKREWGKEGRKKKKP
ncbi:MAG: DUF2085 domain-containing protein [Candidatus Micrarchaeia archaeon]